MRRIYYLIRYESLALTESPHNLSNSNVEKIRPTAVPGVSRKRCRDVREAIRNHSEPNQVPIVRKKVKVHTTADLGECEAEGHDGLLHDKNEGFPGDGEEVAGESAVIGVVSRTLLVVLNTNSSVMPVEHKADRTDRE